MIELRTDRKVAFINEVNKKLIELFISGCNLLFDDEFLDMVVHGSRVNFSSLPSGDGVIRMIDERCIFGNRESIPCQWVGEFYCKGHHCEHFIPINKESMSLRKEMKEGKVNNMDAVCEICLYGTENPHYGECGDLYIGYCCFKDEPIDLNDVACDNYQSDA